MFHVPLIFISPWSRPTSILKRNFVSRTGDELRIFITLGGMTNTFLIWWWRLVNADWKIFWKRSIYRERFADDRTRKLGVTLSYSWRNGRNAGWTSHFVARSKLEFSVNVSNPINECIATLNFSFIWMFWSPNCVHFCHSLKHKQVFPGTWISK